MKDKLKEMAELLRTQDNRITECPIFAVQQKRVVWGMDSTYSDDYKWLHEDCEEASPEEVKTLEEDEDAFNGSFEKAYYYEYWDFVTSFFTEKECLRYIENNRHNLHSPRSYVYGGYRNSEWELIRKYLMENF